jgi:HSP20 family protein
MGEGQLVPVRVYQTTDRIMIAAPMPGLEADDISVVIDGRHVALQGRERGPHQHGLSLLRTEWALGPYRRELELPEPVDGALANATYDNGVLVVAAPKLAADRDQVRVEIHLQRLGGSRGEHVGHVGREITPVSTGERQAGARRRRGHPTAPAPAQEPPAMMIELSAGELEVLRDSLEIYLVDFRREVAGTENPEMRHRLQRRQDALEALLSRVGREAAA